jgi:hypothetical protein
MAEQSQLLEEAQALRDEMKSLERRARLGKQMAAKLVDQLQSEEDTSGRARAVPEHRDA